MLALLPPTLHLQCFCPVHRTSLTLAVVQVCNINPVPSSCVCLLCSAKGLVSQVRGVLGVSFGLLPTFVNMKQINI